ncbi:far upstream element-binding protein 2-like [Zingiber officinale]|uniref:far upstream element-binding protein 2-like n=1 Tax=Zingiber officinale TaxID=94328 RepID=UPI001C4AC661|nr:far upstream element-binding protein 2-like [Zingiber officinale]
MADDLHYSSRPDNKRKFGNPADGVAPSLPTRRMSGFSAPIASSSPDGGSGGASPAQLSYKSVPLPLDGIELAKQRAQEIAARLFNDAEAKRPRVETAGGTDDLRDRGFGSAPSDFTLKHLSQTVTSQIGMTSHPIPTYGFQNSNKKIEIPNGRVGVIIGKSGETIKYLQLQSGAKIQVTRDMDANPNSLTRSVEIVGTSEQISKAEQLINDVLAEADAGASSTIASQKFGSVQPGAEQFQMKVPNNKVGLVIGKGGETIKSMQAKSGARIQVIPLHPPPGDTSTERTVYIDGTQEQIEIAKQLVNEIIISEPRGRNPATSGGYQQGYYAPRPPTSWGAPSAPPAQQPGYAYMPPGAYPGPPPQYNMPQSTYGSYPPSGWDQTSNQSTQKTAPGSGYDYYNQQSQQQQQTVGGSSTDGTAGYNYGQPLPNYNNQASYGTATYSQTSAGQQGYGQDGFSSGYSAPAYSEAAPNPQSGYDQQAYASTLSYGTMGTQSQDGSASAYGAQGGSTQAPAVQQPPLSQPPNTTTAGYQGTLASGYGIPPTSLQRYGNQPPPSTGYGQKPPPSYEQSPQVQKPPAPQSVHGQGQQAQAPPGSYMQSAVVQPGYGQPQPYGVPTQNQPGYVQQQQQQQQPYNVQPPAYSGDNGSETATKASGT